MGVGEYVMLGPTFDLCLVAKDQDTYSYRAVTYTNKTAMFISF